MWAMLTVGPIYLAISTAATSRDHTMLSLTTDSGYWSFTHCTSWYHCLNDTSILPGIALLLKVLIQGVLRHKPMASVLIRWPTSSLGWTGAADEEVVLLGARRLSSRLPPSISLCRDRRLKWLLWGTHPLPLGKVTSQSSASGSPFPKGFPQGVCGGCLGVHWAHGVQSPCRTPPWAVTTHYSQDPQGLLGGVVGFSHHGGVVRG